MAYRPLRVWDGERWVPCGDARVGPLATRVEALENAEGGGGGPTEPPPEDTYQPLSPELTTIAGLRPNDGDVLRRDDGAWTGAPLTKATVGLDQVDNTSDADKPISTLTQAALDTKADTAQAVPPRMKGPYTPAKIPVTGLAAGPRSVVSVTVPDPGFDWYPLCFAELEIRTDVGASRPGLWVRVGSPTGTSYAAGAVPTETTAWTLVQAIPTSRGNGAPLAAGSDRVLHLVVHNLYGGGWIETTDLHASMTVYALPV